MRKKLTKATMPIVRAPPGYGNRTRRRRQYRRGRPSKASKQAQGDDPHCCGGHTADTGTFMNKDVIVKKRHEKDKRDGVGGRCEGREGADFEARSVPSGHTERL